ncbi:MAG: SDR family NAD(P)-dependent oxidoreductase, partial [Pseudomonadota bacterium]
MLLTVLLAVASFQPPTLLAGDDEQKSILVTGASSGIGRHLAETLASAGHHVYAG